MSNIIQVLKINTISEYAFSDIKKKLTDFGYEMVEKVEYPGTYSVTGGIICVWPINQTVSFNLDFFGNKLEQILSTNNKKSVNELEIYSNNILLYDEQITSNGDLIVHYDHGIGKYQGMCTKNILNKNIIYIILEYANSDKIFLPLKQKEKITKYIGVGKKPKLSRLGGSAWGNARKKAFNNALKLAKELLMVYAKRQISEKAPYIINEEWDKFVKKSFGYIETIDQDKALKAVYSDLESKIPQDRLICGDVGFGKTEVALRAMVQAVANGYQAAIVCPTTVLCSQHYANIKARLENLPIRIEMLSRFVEGTNEKEIIKSIEHGRVDIVIGTHRMMSKDIKFKNLDLLIIDEEQRFGVRQKEYFKKLRENINIISLSATPIPRTLFMAFAGIRDISQINTPPKGRKSIDTKIIKKEYEVIKEYLMREKNRKGQIYYLYNEVEKLEAVKRKLENIAPELKYLIAHGQMPPLELKNRMEEFVSNKYDVLICSTIIENGLDIPNVNTLIVEEAENFGLSQLYQIRGRIGRSQRQSYALLCYNQRELTQKAYKRLKAMAENSDLGSGFKVAINDLEIRGGGNILGREQHGNMEAVGLSLYGKLLKQAVDKLNDTKLNNGL